MTTRGTKVANPRKAVRWCVTIQETDGVPISTTRDIYETALRAAKCDAYVLGLETAPSTGKKHIQGYVEFIKRKGISLGALVGLGERPYHAEPAKGTRHANWKYCTKDNAYVQEPGDIHFWEADGEHVGAGKGHRSDLADLRDYLINGGELSGMVFDDEKIKWLRYSRLIPTISSAIQSRSSLPTMKRTVRLRRRRLQSS